MAAGVALGGQPAGTSDLGAPRVQVAVAEGGARGGDELLELCDHVGP